MRKLEICCGDIQSVRAAYLGGADRAELCSALDVGGLTPSAGLIKEAVEIAKEAKANGKSFEVNVLIRPRGGDFVYDNAELAVILEDIRMAQRLGADGVVIGALNTDGSIDIDSMKLMMAEATLTSVTFHRAFDLCSNPEQALQQIIDLGCDRILTSGCAPTAELGIPMLKKLNEQAGDQIIIMAGSGVNPRNAAKILDETGVKEIHASARHLVKSAMEYRRNDVAMGAPDSDEYAYMTTSEDIVKCLAEIVH